MKIIQKIARVFVKLYIVAKAPINYRKVKNKSITIISNNCWGSFMYKSCNLAFNSPFVGLFLFAPDYIYMLTNLPEFLSLDKSNLTFITKEKSVYSGEIQSSYPIGVLSSSTLKPVEIHFLHYKTETECIEKWFKRVKRVDLNNAIIKFSDRDLATKDLIIEFDKLSFKNKVCFTAVEYPLQSVCYLPKYQGQKYVSNEWRYSNKHWNFIDKVNSIQKTNI